jgi:energy-coupling factor transport system permease protein
LARSFFLPRASGLHALYPLTKLVLVLAIVLVGFLARSAYAPIALFLFLILPLALWGRIARDLIRVTLTVILPFVISIALVQGLFYPGATKAVFAIGPLSLKEEGLRFAFGTAGRILLLAGAGLLLLFSTHPADLMLALRQHGMPGALAYIVVAALELIPQMQAQASGILDAQRSRGLETEGSLLTRTRALVPLLGPLVFGALADVDERAMALEARAFSSPQAKTSFKELRDTGRQALARWLLLMSALIVAALEVWRG